MGLKAKIEAVIYAAEEPVTLAQLALLFGAEVLADGETTPSSLSAAPPLLVTGPEPDPASPSVSEADGFAASEAPPDPASDAVPASGLAGDEKEAGRPEQSEGSALPPSDDAPEQSAAPPPEEEQKRLARSRDRLARDRIRAILDELIAEYAAGDRGVEIQEIAGGYRVATKPEYHDAVRNFVKSLKPPMKLSLQALETLAVIAYKQPVTAPEIADIRGVDSAGVLGSLISRKLVTTAGRKQVIGRPILYKTTREFLLRFGLKDLGELPSMEEFEKMAGELSDEPEPTPTPEANAGPDAPADPEIVVTDEDAIEAEQAPEEPGPTISSDVAEASPAPEER